MPLNIVILLISITIFWGYAWIFMKLALDFMGPFTFAALRFATGSITMLIILFFSKEKIPSRSDWPYIALLGFVQTTLVFALLMYGMLFVSAGKSSIMLYSMPIWSMILASIYLGEKISKRKIISVILGTFGLLLIIGVDILSVQNTKTIFGEFLIVLAAFAWGIANIINKKKFKNHNKLLISTWQMTLGTIGLVIIAVLMEWDKPLQFTPLSVSAIVFCGVLASAFCFTGWFIVLAKTDTTVATVSLLFVPVIALFFGWIQLNEELTLGVIMGSILISSGVYLASTHTKNAQPKIKKTTLK